MLTDDEVKKARMIVGVIVGMFLIYLVASAGGIVPDAYNVFERFDEDGIADTPLVSGEGYVSGFPTEVNVTAQTNNSFEISFTCNESYMDGMSILLDPDLTLEDTEAYWTAMSTDWSISEDGLTALYIGDALTNDVTVGDLYLHIDDGIVEGEVDVEITMRLGELDVDEFEIDIIVWSE